MESDVERGLRIVHQVHDDRIVPPELSSRGNEAQDFVGETGHRSKCFHLAIGEPGRLQHGSLHHFAGVADQGHAFFTIPFQGQLYALNDAHAGEALQEGSAIFMRDVDIRHCGSKGGFSFRFIGDEFFQLLTLFGCQRCGLHESRCQGAIGAQLVEILHQFLNRGSRQGFDCGDEEFGGTARTFYQRQRDGRFVDEVASTVPKKLNCGMISRKRCREGVCGLSEQRVFGAFSDKIVGIFAKNCQQFRSFDRR